MDDEKKIEIISKPQSNTLAAVGTTLAGAAVAGVAWNSVGNLLSRYLGNIGANIGTLNGSLPGVAPVIAPTVIPTPVFATNSSVNIPFEGGVSKELVDAKVKIATLESEKYADNKIAIASDKFVSKELAVLMAENSQLKAEKYADARVDAVNGKVVELEKKQAVNEARDKDFRHYVEREFIHQPKAHMKRRLLETTDDCCCDHCHDRRSNNGG